MSGQKQNPFKNLHIKQKYIHTHPHLHGLCELSSCSQAVASQKNSQKISDGAGIGWSCAGELRAGCLLCNAEFDSIQSQKSAFSVYCCVYVFVLVSVTVSVTVICAHLRSWARQDSESIQP